MQQVLLHACCAPCSSAIVEWMLQHDVHPTIIYYNPTSDKVYAKAYVPVVPYVSLSADVNLIKDDVITQIEKQYNQSSTKMFNIQFTSELDFITGVKNRLEKFPDENTRRISCFARTF